MRIHHILVFLFSAGLSMFVQAQPCYLSVQGVVLDRATREPLSFTTIGIQELNEGLLADEDGKFVFHSVCPGEYHFQLHHLGCAPVNYFIRITQDTSLVLFLDHHTEFLQEVIVEGKPSTFQESQSQQSIPHAVLQQQAGKPLAEIISRIAGVRSLQNGSAISKPVIHGLIGNRVAVINNGLIQAGQQWGNDHAPEIDPLSATEIRVVKGSDAIEYGSNAIGGAVIVEAGPIPKDPHVHGVVNYGIRDNGWMHTLNARLQRSTHAFDWRIQFGGKTGGDQRTPDYFLTNTGTREIGLSLQLQRQRNENSQQFYYSLFHTRLGIFSGAHHSNLTDLEMAFAREVPFNINDAFSYRIAPPKQHVTHHLLKYARQYWLNEYTSFDWFYGLQLNQRAEFDIRRGDRSDIPALDLQMWSHTLKIVLNKRSGAWPMRTGLQLTYIDNENNPETGILPLIPDYREGNASLFGILKRKVNAWQFEAGGRYDLQAFKVWSVSTAIPRTIRITDHLYHDFAFSLGSVFSFGESQVRFNNALTSRSPEVNELYSQGLHQGVAGIEEGEVNLKAETGLKSTLTTFLHFESGFHLEVGLFSNRVNDFIYLRPTDELRLTIRGAFPVFRYEQDDAWIRGLDIVGVWDLGEKIEWTSRFSWLKGTLVANRQPLPLMPPWQWTNAVSMAFTDGKTRKGTRLQIEGEFNAAQKDWDEEREFVPPPEGYMLLTARLESAWRMSGTYTLYTSLSLENGLDSRYRNYLNRLRYFADEPGRSINFRVRLEF